MVSNTKMKKVLIDVNSVVPYYVTGRLNGIGRTTMELVKALDGLGDLPVEIELYSQNMKGVGAKDLQTKFKEHHLYFPHREKWDKVIACTPIREWMTGYDLMHIPHNFDFVYCPEKCVATVHDAMFFSHPETHIGFDFARTHYTPFARRCKGVITCSHSSKREIVEYMGVEADKVHVIHWGVDTKVMHQRPVSERKFSSGAPFFTSVSCDIGRKNTIAVLRAYDLFMKDNPEAAHHLVLVWRNPSEEALQVASLPHLRDRVHFASGVTDEELGQIYSDATATFFPSRYEGFGLPVLESMVSGTPVVTCSNSSLSEVGGEAAIYVEPDDIEAMKIWMARFECDPVQAELQKKVLQQASGFTWEHAAQKTLEVYLQCLS